MAGRIPQNFINDLLERVDIVDIIDSRVPLKKSGRNYQARCPFHDEKTPSFSVNPENQYYKCFGCGESGTAITFLMEYERMEFVEAVEALARHAGVEVPREKGGGPVIPPRTDLYDLMARAVEFYRRSLKASTTAVDYLKGRGLTGEVARDFGVGYAPDEWHAVPAALPDVSEAKLLEAGLLTRNDKGNVYDRFRGRIMFPIRDVRGRVIAFGGRVLGNDDGPKYLNSPETPLFHKSEELYGLFEARRALRSISRLLVVEGYMDVVALAQNGVANAVATLGTATGTPHYRKLFRYTDEVVCCFDGDRAGRAAAWRGLEAALPELNENRQLKFVFLPDGEDPDSLVRARGRAAFDEFVSAATPATEFLFARLSDGLDLTSIDGKAKFAALAAPHIAKVPDGLLKTLMNERVRETTGLRPSRAARAPQSQVAQAVRAVSRNRANRGLERLCERLLTILLRQPSVWLTLPEPQVAYLTGAVTAIQVQKEVAADIEASARDGRPPVRGTANSASPTSVAPDDFGVTDDEEPLISIASLLSASDISAMASEWRDGVPDAYPDDAGTDDSDPFAGIADDAEPDDGLSEALSAFADGMADRMAGPPPEMHEGGADMVGSAGVPEMLVGEPDSGGREGAGGPAGESHPDQAPHPTTSDASSYESYQSQNAYQNRGGDELGDDALPPAPVDPLVEAILAAGPESPQALLLEVAAYAAANPGSDASEILAAWTGEPGYEHLVHLSARSSGLVAELGAEGLAAEFADGVMSLRERAARAQRRSMLEAQRAAPDARKFQHYWDLTTEQSV